MIIRAALVISTLLVAVPSTFAATLVDLTVGHSHVVKPAGEPGTVIVGDDSIANANIASGNTIILTGKAVGSTNLIVLDESGSEILSSTLQVSPVDRRPQTQVRVIKGGSNEQRYVCGAGQGCSEMQQGDELAAATRPATADAVSEPAVENSAPADAETPESGDQVGEEQVSSNP